TAKDKGLAGEVSASTEKKGRTVAITAEDMQKRKNDVNVRTTLLLDLPDEHQLRFSKYDSAKELWEAILKTFESLKQTFNRLQAIVSYLEFLDVPIEQDDLNQKFLISLAPEWLVTKLKEVKKEKESIDFKKEKFKNASKDLDRLLKSQKLDKDKKGVGFNEYCVVLHPHAQVYSPHKKDLSWMCLLEFVDDTVTDYTRPTPSIYVLKSVSKELKERWKSNNPSFFEQGGSSGNVVAKPTIKFVKESSCPNATKVNNTKNSRKPTVKYAEMYRTLHKVLEEYVSFGHGRGKITGKGSIKIGKLEYENVYFVEELKYNLFSVSQIYDNKNSILFTDTECLVLGKVFKLVDDKHVLLKTARQQNMYIINLKNVAPHKNLTCLIAKALVDESMLWHMRLGHLNFKTMNKLVMSNMVKGLPSKSFENDHSCVACLKGKQHKASCKYKLVNSVSNPLHTLYMDLFGPTSANSLNHKWIFRNFITEIENLKDLNVKIIKSDNGGEYTNKEMDEFCSKKGIKRKFSNARTPQQNGVSEIRNRTLIKAARTMLADAKLPVTFWAEAVNTACYVKNMVLVIKPHNKTPYELFNERSPVIGFLRPFGCHVMMLNTLDHLGKFDAKGDEGYFLRYSLSSKAFRVFNKRTKKIEDNLHVNFLENRSIEKGTGPDWLFDIDTLTNAMNYVLVVVAGTSSTNISGIKEDVHQAMKEKESPLRFIALPNWFHEAQMATSNEAAKKDDAIPDNNAPQKEQEDVNGDKEVPESSGNSNPTASTKVSSNDSFELASSSTVEIEVPTVSTPVPTGSQYVPLVTLSVPKIISRGGSSHPEPLSFGNAMSFENRLEEFFGDTSDASQIIGLIDTPVQTRQKTKNVNEQSFIATIHQKTPDLLQYCLYSCFLSQEEPKKIVDALKDPSCVEAMQQKLLQFKIQNV
nr:hypothetical protein [Tanacetum cinerariifolium]